uniref:Uncharacterized protein n=1 Tax=Brassica oleracea var. oleracea TaxID=109376 RepID=A0A0D3ASE7_BRAOL
MALSVSNRKGKQQTLDSISLLLPSSARSQSRRIERLRVLHSFVYHGPKK